MTEIERIHAEFVAQQPGRTAYIDECGGFGFEFNKPDVSAYYVVCAVIVDNEKILAIENKIEEIKKLCFGGGEMKSSSISANHARRAKVLTELLMLDIQLIVLIANKKEFIEGSPLLVDVRRPSEGIVFLSDKIILMPICTQQQNESPNNKTIAPWRRKMHPTSAGGCISYLGNLDLFGHRSRQWSEIS